MKEKTAQILRSYFNQSKSNDEESQKRAINETAARLIKSDIKTNVTSVTDSYPPVTDLRLQPSLEFIPDSLRLLLYSLFVGDSSKKVASVGQSIVQAARPRAVVAPLQIELSVQMHHLSGLSSWSTHCQPWAFVHNIVKFLDLRRMQLMP